MNALQKPAASQIRHDVVFEKQVIAAVHDAYAGIESLTQKCLIAGQLLNEWKEQAGHEIFIPWCDKHFPNYSIRTYQRWMLGSRNVLKALPPPPIDIEVSVLLSTPINQLTTEQKKWKQLQFNLTNDRTMKDCAAGVFVEGDDAHRIDRAINGKTKGGKGNVDRKDFPLFIGRKLSDLNTHLSHYKSFSGPQLERVETLTKQHVAKMPSGYLEMLSKHIKEELKTR